MSDPFDELTDFEAGVPVSPSPAAEIRRRGERLRRRNALMTVGGAVAAIVLVAVPVAIVSGDDGGTPQPAPPAGLSQRALLTADELPVREGLSPYQEMPPDGQLLACAPRASASLDETRGFRRDFRADAEGAPVEETANSVIRTAVLQFDDSADARAAYDEVQGWLLGCPGGDDLARKGVSLSTLELRDGRGEWRLHEFYATDVCTGCDAIRFDRMGVARFGDRLVLVSLAEVGGPLEPEGLDSSMNDVFEDAIGKAGGAITGIRGEDDSGVPEPQPLRDALAAGLSKPDGVEVLREGPGPRAQGAEEVSPCDQGVWPVDGVDRLAVTETGPMYAAAREVVELAAVDDAVAAMARLRSAVTACPTEVNELDPTNSPEMAWTVEQADTGYEDSVTFSQTYVDGMPGGAIWQFTRVGRGILATFVGGEYAPGRSVSLAVEQLTEATRAITPSLCMYTEAGC